MKIVLVILIVALVRGQSLLLSDENVLLEKHHKKPVSKQADSAELIGLMRKKKEIQDQCLKLDKDVKATEKQKESDQKFLDWLQMRITGNQKRAQKLQSLLCSNGNLFLTTLTNQKLYKELLQYLNKRVDNTQTQFLEESINFIQGIQVEDEFQSTILSLECISDLIKNRSEFASFEKQLNDILPSDSLNWAYEQNQIKSYDTSDMFLKQLNKETEDLQIHLNRAQTLFNRDPVLVAQQKQATKCKADLDAIDEQINAIKNCDKPN